jgi:hypothetical protein
MGLWITFVLVVAVFALMGWSVVQTHRGSPVETIQRSRSFWPSGLDAVDVLIVLVSWFALPFLLGSWFDTITADRAAVLGILLLVGAGAVWLRRRLLPATVIRFDPRNIALRSASVFCGLASLVALSFGGVARPLGQSGFLAWSFFATAAGLAVLAASLHAIEFRRRPRPSSEDPDDGSCAPTPVPADSEHASR